MYYRNLGGSSLDNLTGNQVSVDGVTLNNIQSDYWSGTGSASYSSNAWAFFFFNGGQGNFGKTSALAAWAVRSGDVGAVPVPAAVWLFCSALGIVIWTRRKAA